jgi:hypothetical protein
LRIVAFFFLAVLIPFNAWSQQYYRIKADYSVKEKRASGEAALTIGKVYFDKNAGQVVYLNTFPEKNTVLAKDSLMFLLKDGKQVGKSRNLIPSKFTVFSLALNNELKDFGLTNTIYKLTEVTKEEDMVIKTWTPQGPTAKQFGKIMLSIKKNQLFGVVIFDNKDKLVAKQFFNEYKVMNGLPFPSEIVQISYVDGKENYQVTSFRNVIVNDFKEEHIYNMRVAK